MHKNGMKEIKFLESLLKIRKKKDAKVQNFERGDT